MKGRKTTVGSENATKTEERQLRWKVSGARVSQIEEIGRMRFLVIPREWQRAFSVIANVEQREDNQPASSKYA
jgi:hypothetical protein